MYIKRNLHIKEEISDEITFFNWISLLLTSQECHIIQLFADPDGGIVINLILEGGNFL